MGCWGITAFESDEGLDAVELIRKNLRKDGKMDVKTILNILQRDSWSSPPDETEGCSHSSPMALAELIVKFLDGQTDDLDYEGCDKQFSSLTSFTADKNSIRWLRDYLSDTLRFKREDAAVQEENGERWGGWFQEQSWIDWQKHMEQLTERMDKLLALKEKKIELIGAEIQKEAMDIQKDVPVLRM